MHRRNFITGLAGVAAATVLPESPIVWPTPPRASILSGAAFKAAQAQLNQDWLHFGVVVMRQTADKIERIDPRDVYLS